MLAIYGNGIALAARAPLDAVTAKQALMKCDIGKGVYVGLVVIASFIVFLVYR